MEKQVSKHKYTITFAFWCFQTWTSSIDLGIKYSLILMQDMFQTYDTISELYFGTSFACIPICVDWYHV